MLKPAYEMRHLHRKSHGRIHHIQQGRQWFYRPGVTTVLDKGGPEQPWLEAWRQRIGEAEAERIRLDATDRGTAVHALIESTLTGEPVIIPDESYALGPPDRNRIAGMFEKIAPVLEHDIHEVLGVELVAQWFDPSGGAGNISNGFAGSIDCIAKVDFEDGRGPVTTLLDWKTAAKPKRDDRIGNYRMQLAAYRAAAQASYPTLETINDAVIVIIPERGDLQLVHIPEDEFGTLELDFLDRLQAYYDRLGWPESLEPCEAWWEFDQMTP